MRSSAALSGLRLQVFRSRSQSAGLQDSRTPGLQASTSSSPHVARPACSLLLRQHPQLPHDEEPLIDGVTEQEIQGLPLPMARLAIDPDDDGLFGGIRGGGCLQRSGHFSSVKCVHAGVMFTGRQEHRRILCPRSHLLVGRVCVQKLELARIFGRSILRDPVPSHEKVLIPKHVEEWHCNDRCPEEIWPLGHQGAGQQASV